MKSRYSATALLLVTVLVIANASPIALADNPAAEGRLANYSARPAAGSVSSNAISQQNLVVNGRRVTGEQLIWGGELIEASTLAGARIGLDKIGDLSLSAASAIRLGDVSSFSSPSVSAALLTGSLAVNLDPLATATIDSTGRRFVATGASFKVAIINREAVLTTFSGEVRIEQQTPPTDVNIRIVDDLGRPVASGSQLSVRARSTRQIQVQVTDKNDKPLPDLPVLFSLGNPCLGSVGFAGLAGGAVFQKKTDNKGIAAVILTAGASRCAGSIVAKVEGTNAQVEFKTEIVEKKSFWNTRNTLLVSAALAGAGIGIGLAVANSNDDAIRPIPPPGVKP